MSDGRRWRTVAERPSVLDVVAVPVDAAESYTERGGEGGLDDTTVGRRVAMCVAAHDAPDLAGAARAHGRDGDRGERAPAARFATSSRRALAHPNRS